MRDEAAALVVPAPLYMTITHCSELLALLPAVTLCAGSRKAASLWVLPTPSQRLPTPPAALQSRSKAACYGCARLQVPLMQTLERGSGHVGMCAYSRELTREPVVNVVVVLQGGVMGAVLGKEHWYTNKGAFLQPCCRRLISHHPTLFVCTAHVCWYVAHDGRARGTAQPGASHCHVLRGNMATCSSSAIAAACQRVVALMPTLPGHCQPIPPPPCGAQSFYYTIIVYGNGR